MKNLFLILKKRKRDTSQRGFEDWSFMSVQTWGENASGLWKLKIKANQGVTGMKLSSN